MIHFRQLRKSLFPKIIVDEYMLLLLLIVLLLFFWLRKKKHITLKEKRIANNNHTKKTHYHYPKNNKKNTVYPHLDTQTKQKIVQSVNLYPHDRQSVNLYPHPSEYAYNNPTIVQPIKEIFDIPRPKNFRKSRRKIKIESDPQNVHDSNVSDNMGTIYNQIKAKNEGVFLLDLSSLVTEVDKSDLDNKTKVNALRTIETIRDTKGTSSILRDNELNILRNIWTRINDDENIAQKEMLTENFIESLADASDNEYSTVCLSGRCARMLGSLTLLDADPIIAEPIRTKDMIKAQIMTLAGEIFTSELNNQDAFFLDKYNSGDYYSDVDEFNIKTKQKISDIITQKYEPILGKEETKKMITDATSY